MKETKLYKCINHNHYELRKNMDLWYTTVKVPLFLENSWGKLNLEYISSISDRTIYLYGESILDLAKKVSKTKATFKYGKRIFPGIHISRYESHFKFFVKIGYKNYKHFNTIEEAGDYILRSFCKFVEVK
jgi:hypothetical protein